MPKRIATPDPEIVLYLNGYYGIRLPDGRERSLGTKDFGEACRRKQAVKDKLAREGKRSGGKTCGDVIEKYFEYRSERILLKDETIEQLWVRISDRLAKPNSRGTVKEIKYTWNQHLGLFFNSVRLSVLSRDVDDLWREYVAQAAMVDLRNHRKVMNGFLSWAAQEKLVGRRKWPLPVPVKKARARRVLRPEEVHGLLTHAKGSLLLFVSMYLFMGMRTSEILRMKRSSVHLEEGYLEIMPETTKTRRYRAIPINGFVLKLLKIREAEQKAQQIETPFVFPNRRDHQRHADETGLKTAWQTVRRKNGWPDHFITPHDLRATYEAYLHKTPNLTDTQREKAAGSSIEVQKRIYLNYQAEDLKGVEEAVNIEGLDELMKSKIDALEKAQSNALGNALGTGKQDLLH